MQSKNSPTCQQLTEKPTQNNPSGIYKLKCNTCNRAYIGQSGRSTAVRHKEHVRYIRTNNPTSAYALQILNNKHDFGTTEETLKLLKPCHKGPQMKCWETFYMQLFHQHVNDINPLYEIKPQNCNFCKVRHRLPDDRPGRPKHVGAIMRYFKCIF